MMGRAIGLAAALLLALAGTASAATGSLVGVRPAADDQSWLVMTVASGQTVRATALVLNLSDDPQTVAIGTADGVTTPEGVFTLAGDAETPRGVGAWIHVSRASATLAPGERLRLPVTIAVPPGTTPGDYSGGITVQAGARERQAADGGLAVRVVERVGLRVYVTVPGVRDGSLAVQKLETTAKDGGGLRGALGLPESLDVHFAVRNTGNVQYPRAQRRGPAVRGRRPAQHAAARARDRSARRRTTGRCELAPARVVARPLRGRRAGLRAAGGARERDGGRERDARVRARPPGGGGRRTGCVRALATGPACAVSFSRRHSWWSRRRWCPSPPPPRRAVRASMWTAVVSRWTAPPLWSCRPFG